MTSGLPYRGASRESVTPGGWAVDLGKGAEALPALLATWDYGTDLQLTREIRIDLERMRSESRLTDGQALGVCAIWQADRHTRGSGEVERLPSGGELVELTLSLDLPGRDMGSSLRLETQILLVEQAETDTTAVAEHAGSVLWRDSKTVKLQGGAPRFPMAVVNPSEFGMDPAAPWMVQIRQDLDAPVMGAVYLLVNETNERVTQAVTATAESEALAATVLSTMYHDIGSTLVDFALTQDELWERDDFPQDSFGRSLRLLFDSAMRGQSRADALAQRDSDPGFYAMTLSASLGLMASGL